MKNFHAVSVKYLPATNYRPSRVKLTSERFGDSVTINYDYTYNSALDIATAWLDGRGQKVVGHAETRKGAGIVILGAIENRFYGMSDLKQCAHGVPQCVLCATCMKNHEKKLKKQNHG